MARSMSEVCQRWVELPRGSNRSWRAIVSMSESNIAIPSCFSLDDVPVCIQRDRAIAHIGFDVDLPVTIQLHQPAAIDKGTGDLDIAQRDIGVAVSRGVWRNSDECAGRGTGEKCLEDDAQRPRWNAARSRECKGLRHAASDAHSVDLAKSRHENDPPRRGRGQAIRPIRKRGD